MLRRFSALLICSLSSAFVMPVFAQLDSKAATPPTAEKIPKIVGLHGDKLTDNYFWLREKENPKVLDYLKAENAYTEAVMAPYKQFEASLYAEMLGRIKQTDESAPYPQRGYFLYSRTVEGKQYPILCRKKGSVAAPEEIYLDVNQLAEGEKFMALGEVDWSDDNQLLAYSTDTNGHRDYDFHLKRFATGEEIKTPIGKVANFGWAADNRTLFYVTEDNAKRSYRCWRYTLGDKAPKLIYEEKDPLFQIVVGRSSDQSAIFLLSSSSRTTEARFLPADQPTSDFRLIAKRRNEIKYYPDLRGDLFYIRTNDGAKEYKMVTAPRTKPDEKSWKLFLPEQKGVKIDAHQTFKDFLLLVERENGLPQFRVYDFKTKQSHRITFPEPSYEAEPGQNEEFDTAQFRFRYQSPITPLSAFDYDMAKQTRVLVKQQEVLGGYDSSKYVVERIAAKAKDGTDIPITVVRNKDVALDGQAPGWLYGYGSYGISIDANFSTSRISLLDRGLVYAIGHIRGGGEMGQNWHDQARMLTKMNTFTDFIACADYLVEKKYVSRDRLVIEGGSAGGLLIGATLNLRPDLCRAAILEVPFVDMLNTMSDASLPLTTGEYIEWGNPSKKNEYAYMKTYSPYDNLAAKNYPAMLLMTSLNDSQVPYWEPAKYTAKLRTLRTDANPMLLRTNLEAGHGGASGRYDRLKETAFEYTFGLAVLGLAK
jgi:oligopeptidase B